VAVPEERVLQRAGVDHDHGSVAVAGRLQGGAGALRDGVDGGAELRLERGVEFLKQPGVVGAGRRGESERLVDDGRVAAAAVGRTAGDECRGSACGRGEERPAMHRY